MEESKCLHVKQHCIKESFMKHTKKVQEALAAKLETVNMDSILETRVILVSTTTEQLQFKLCLLN